jgi:hypothetical protein
VSNENGTFWLIDRVLRYLTTISLSDEDNYSDLPCLSVRNRTGFFSPVCFCYPLSVHSTIIHTHLHLNAAFYWENRAKPVSFQTKPCSFGCRETLGRKTRSLLVSVFDILEFSSRDCVMPRKFRCLADIQTHDLPDTT